MRQSCLGGDMRAQYARVTCSAQRRDTNVPPTWNWKDMMAATIEIEKMNNYRGNTDSRACGASRAGLRADARIHTSDCGGEALATRQSTTAKVV
jgi:hypothetical protein